MCWPTSRWPGASSSSRSTTTRATSATAPIPLLVFDAWEHAFYLQYKNVKADFFAALWNIVNWSDVAARLDSAKGLKVGG